MRLSRLLCYPVLGAALSLLLTGQASAQTTLTQTAFTGVIVPQYLANGPTSPNASRLPFAFRATITGSAVTPALAPSTTYRYFNQLAGPGDLGTTNPGAGNVLFPTGPNFTYATNAGLTSAGNYSTFTTDASGNYTGWFFSVATGNARFDAGNTVIPSLVIGSNSGTLIARLALDQTLTVLSIANAAGANNGTFLRGQSGATAKNIVSLYATTSSARPLATAVVESTGATIASTPTGYSTAAGAYNTLLPNTNANGVRYIEQRALATNALVGCAQDADGIWPSGANTVNPTSGFTSINLTATDAPLSSCTANATPTITSLAPASATAGSGGFTLTVNGTGFVSGSTVRWNGADRTTTFVSSTQLTASIPTGDIAAPGSATVTVFSPLPGGGVSGGSTFSINPPATPSIILTGGGALTAFSTSVGTPSATQSYQVAGSNLTSGINLTAPTDFEVSTASGSGFGASLNLSQATVQPGPVTVYVRFNPATAGTAGGNLQHTATSAPTQNIAVTGFALSAQPTTKSSVSFGTATASSLVVNFTGGDGQKRLVVAREGQAPNSLPADGTTYSANAAYGTAGTALGSNFVVYSGTGNSVTVTGLNDLTQYYFTVFEFNDDNVTGAANYLTSTPIAGGNATTPTAPPTTYTWNVASGNWADASSWSPARTTPRSSDILIFDGAVQASPTAVLTSLTPTGQATYPTAAGVTVYGLKFINGVDATLTDALEHQINVAGNQPGDDFVVEAGAKLTLQNTVSGSGIYLLLTPGQTGSVLGTITMDGTVTTASGATSRLLAVNPTPVDPTTAPLVFGNGSVLLLGRNFSTNAFGDQAAYSNSVTFASGATLRQQGGSNPFGQSQPATNLILQPGSTFRYEQWNSSPAGSGRTYGNFIVDIQNPPLPAQAVISLTGSSALRIKGDLRVLNATSATFATSPMEISGNIEINAPTTLSSASLTFNGASAQTLSGTNLLTLTGAAIVVNSALTATNAAVRLGTVAQNISGTGSLALYDLTTGTSAVTATLGVPTTLRHLLTLNTGTLASGGNLTLLSDATGTALVVNAGAGTVTGNTTVQRYLAQNATGYRHLSAPVSTTLNDLATTHFTPFVNPAYNAIPAPALTLAQFPNIFAFDETRGGAGNTSFVVGYASPTATSNPMEVGRGYSVYFPGSDVPDFTGALNNGTVTRTGLTRTGAVGAGVQKAGWHLLGNPYPSPLDWDLVSIPAGLSPQVSVWQSTGGSSGSYAVYTNGIGPAGADLLPLGQAFFVRVTGSGPVNFSFTNAARVTTYANPTMNRAAQPDPRSVLGLRLRRAGSAGTGDEAFVYFENGATADYDERFDGEKPAHNPGEPTLVSLTPTATELAINGLDESALRAGTTVPLLLDLPSAGSYELLLSRLDNFTGTDAQLIDHLTGTRYDLATTPRLSFHADQAGELRGRFALTFGQRVTGLSAEAASTNLTVFPNPSQGAFRVTIGADLTVTRATLTDALGRTVATPTLTSGTTDVQLGALPAGVYSLRLLTNAGPLTRRIVIE
jgi:trimeric autotransporter adhesin